MSDAQQEVQPAEAQPVVNGDAQVNGDAVEQSEQQEELVQGVSFVLPAPPPLTCSHPRDGPDHLPDELPHTAQAR